MNGVICETVWTPFTLSPTDAAAHSHPDSRFVRQKTHMHVRSHTLTHCPAVTQWYYSLKNYFHSIKVYTVKVGNYFEGQDNITVVTRMVAPQIRVVETTQIHETLKVHVCIPMMDICLRIPPSQRLGSQQTWPQKKPLGRWKVTNATQS